MDARTARAMVLFGVLSAVLARALCAGQRLLLLDEPVTGLDPASTKEMYSIIYDLNRNKSTAIIMISHDVEEALKYATHILHVGSKVFYGTKAEYLKSVLGAQFLDESVDGGSL